MKKRMRVAAVWVVLLAAVCLLPGGCGFTVDMEASVAGVTLPVDDSSSAPPAYPVEAGGVRLDQRPARVVSLAPSLTEKVDDLGLLDRLAGVSDYCDYPAGVEALERYGTAQIPQWRELAALEPDLVLAESPLPARAMAALGERGIPVAVLPHAGSVEELLALYVDLGRLLEGETEGGDRGRKAAGHFRDRLEAMSRDLRDYTAANGGKRVLYLLLSDGTAATGDTFEGELLTALSMDNAAADFTRWELPLETAAGKAALARAEALFLDPRYTTIEDLEGNGAYKDLPAVVHNRYFYISSIAIERQSLRTLDTLAAMAEYVYPEAGA